MLNSRAVRYLLRERRLLVVTALILLSEAIVAVLLPLPLKFLTDSILVNSQKSSYEFYFWFGEKLQVSIGFVLFHALLALFLLGFIASILDYAEENILALLSTKVVDKIRQKLLFAIFERRMDFLDSQRKVELLSKISSDTANFNFIVSALLPTILRAVPTLIFIITSMLLVDFRFALIIGVLLPVMLFLCHRFAQFSRNAIKRFSREQARFEADTHEALSAMPLIKSITSEKRIISELFRQIRSVSQRQIESQRMQGKLVASLSGSKYIARFCIILAGSFAVLKQTLTIGELVLFVSYVELLTKPVGEIAKLSSKLTRAIVSIDRIEQLFRLMRGRKEFGGNQNLRDFIPGKESFTLRFKNVSLDYNDGHLILKDFSANFNSGDFILVKGESGAGKTSFAKLFNRLLDPTSGEITIESKSLQDFTLLSLRNFVYFVSQESYFVHGTVLENLQIAANGADIGEWSSALQKVNAFAFVQSLPQSVQTKIGDGGRVLSGGQKRRLSIARAFLRKRARIFVFDEATSGIDPISARIIFQSAKDLANEGALVFWITHREEEVQADKVLHFSIGRNPTYFQENLSQRTLDFVRKVEQGGSLA